MSETSWNEERIAGLLGVLRPAPRGWVEAAAELPRLRSMLDGLVARAESDAAVRATVIADLETALEDAGVEPTPRTVAELRARLQS